MESIKISKNEYIVCEPTFIVLDAIKNETGYDLALGLKDETMKHLTSDFKQLSKVTALILKDEEDEEFDIKKVDVRQEYLYRNAKLSDFVKVMGFFSKELRASVSGSQEPAQGMKVEKEETRKDTKQKMKLLKKD